MATMINRRIGEKTTRNKAQAATSNARFMFQSLRSNTNVEGDGSSCINDSFALVSICCACHERRNEGWPGRHFVQIPAIVYSFDCAKRTPRHRVWPPSEPGCTCHEKRQCTRSNAASAGRCACERFCTPAAIFYKDGLKALRIALWKGQVDAPTNTEQGKSLVIGGTGLVGGYIVDHLVRSGERPLALSRSHRTGRASIGFAAT